MGKNKFINRRIYRNERKWVFSEMLREMRKKRVRVYRKSFSRKLYIQKAINFSLKNTLEGNLTTSSSKTILKWIFAANKSGNRYFRLWILRLNLKLELLVFLFELHFCIHKPIFLKTTIFFQTIIGVHISCLNSVLEIWQDRNTFLFSW